MNGEAIHEKKHEFKRVADKHNEECFRYICIKVRRMNSKVVSPWSSCPRSCPMRSLPDHASGDTSTKSTRVYASVCLKKKGGARAGGRQLNLCCYEHFRKSERTSMT